MSASGREPAEPVSRLANGVVVSAQTHRPGGPLDDPATLVRLALAAELGGASGIRVASPAVVALLRPRTTLPIIGITKRPRVTDDGVYITPSVADALALIDAGADIVAADARPDLRPAETFAQIVSACHERGVPVVADCAVYDDGVSATRDGADLVATTLAGYTAATRGVTPPDLRVAGRWARELPVPVVVEGGVWDPGTVTAAFDAGAFAVVVGSAVTDAERITRRLVAAADRTSPVVATDAVMSTSRGEGDR